MKKKLLSLAVMAMTASAFIMAQNPANTTCRNGNAANGCQTDNCVTNNCVSKGNCASTDCAGAKNNNRNHCGNHRGKAPRQDCFAGLNLTEQQKTALKAIPTPCQTMSETRKAAAQSDSARIDRQQRRQVAQDVRKNYLAQVKAVLTPDQYVQFLENYYANSPAFGQNRHGKPGHGVKGHRHHGHKPDCGNLNRCNENNNSKK